MTNAHIAICIALGIAALTYTLTPKPTPRSCVSICGGAEYSNYSAEATCRAECYSVRRRREF